MLGGRTISIMFLVGNVHKTATALSVVCYGAALCLPGLAPRESNPYGFTGVTGYVCLLFGWSTAVASTAYFLSWLANLFYFPALLMWIFGITAPRWGALIIGMGLALAAQIFRIDTFMVNEAGHRVAVRPGLGGWLWLASFAILLAGFLLHGRWKGRAVSATFR